MERKKTMRKTLILIGLITLILVMEGCKKTEETTKPGEEQTSKELKNHCEVDTDCVPEQCCHATSCVNEKYAPNCKEIFCTMECVVGTMDCCPKCGCKCNNNKCETTLNA